jgi:hypothetical protein
MPCFKGIAVSIHSNGAPLPEYGIQKQSRVQRINSYIPVPQPTLSPESNKPEPAKFAISITLLTPGLAIPYSTPRATETNPDPKPQFVGQLPSSTGERGQYHGVVEPYKPMTSSDHETIAAYIYFDGRAKEEVATLLRPGEETWVNSRWVQVPLAEGGGLAEREFLFREVGLERWLNGLDLQGDDAAAKTERRRQKFERRRRKQEASEHKIKREDDDGVMEIEGDAKKKSVGETLRYGDGSSPVEAVSEDDSDWSSDDEPPETAGQIKVAMFRVIASGEIKKGEYSPQFDAHDDDDEEGGARQNGVDADVEHTTSFAKPKTLDPKTISTQTVTGIDGPDKPYAVFTFFYRGQRRFISFHSYPVNIRNSRARANRDLTGQLQKMGVLPSSKPSAATPASIKRRSGQLDFSNLGPLKTQGTVGFSAFRDHKGDLGRKKKSRKNSNSAMGVMDEDSDDDDDDEGAIKLEDEDEEKNNDAKKDKSLLGPEDARLTGELAESVNRIRVSHATPPNKPS